MSLSALLVRLAAGYASSLSVTFQFEVGPSERVAVHRALGGQTDPGSALLAVALRAGLVTVGCVRASASTLDASAGSTLDTGAGGPDGG